nr:GDSL-type esterase/lipase family protein [Streptomyces sp. NRRL F-5126]
MRRGRRTAARGVGAAAAVAALLAAGGCGSPHHGQDARGTSRPPSSSTSSSSSSKSPSPSPSPSRTAAAATGWDRDPASVAAVGDSITRGFDACGLLRDCPSVSWSTGTDPSVDSLALRLLGPAHVRDHSWNAARSGATMAALPAQMARVAVHRPGLVTVAAGANDACRSSVDGMTSVASFRTSFETAMRKLRAVSPSSQVYVSSVPDLRRLWATGRANPLGREVWKLGICASMLGDAQSDDAAARQRRQTVYDRIVAYNGVLRDVCAHDRRCRYDGGAVFGYRFSAKSLSPFDFFHPSKQGQATLARIAYARVTAARPTT